jgi:lactate dehydrogenase-like 2-hydroxyacid dehydrogenase
MKVFLTFDPPGRARHMLEERFEVTAWDGPGFATLAALQDHLPGSVGLYCTVTTPVTDDLLALAPDLRAISQCAVGVDNIDLDACRRRGIKVGHTPDVLTETTADTAFALLLAGSRRFREGIDFVRNDEWKSFDMNLLLGGDVHHTSLGIVGMGRIGQAIAHRAAGFGMEVIYTRRSETLSPYGRQVNFDTLLTLADHVVVSVPLTPATTGLIDADALRRMKPTAGLINISRGPVVVTDHLVQALAEGWIRYAALDVTDPEPLPGNHPLLGFSNCLVIPHLGSSSSQTRAAMAELAATNLIAALTDKEMPSRIA